VQSTNSLGVDGGGNPPRMQKGTIKETHKDSETSEVKTNKARVWGDRREDQWCQTH
jgi:hypothetical protein